MTIVLTFREAKDNLAKREILEREDQKEIAEKQDLKDLLVDPAFQ